MRTNRLKFLIVFGMTLVTSIQAWAQSLSPHTESIESTAANADSVFIARLEKHALNVLCSEDYWKRREGAKPLRYFKSDDNIARLRTFLDDPGSYVSHPENKPNIEQHYHSVRAEAYQTLKSWGVEVEESVIRERKNVKE